MQSHPGMMAGPGMPGMPGMPGVQQPIHVPHTTHGTFPTATTAASSGEPGLGRSKVSWQDSFRGARSEVVRAGKKLVDEETTLALSFMSKDRQFVKWWGYLTAGAYFFLTICLVNVWVGGILPLRWFVGGFSPLTRGVLLCLALGGIICGSAGAWAAQNKGSVALTCLRIFASYCLVRCVLLCVCFGVDMMQLRSCEQYIGSFGANFHYDLVLDSVAKSGECWWSRFIFLLFWNVDFLASTYATWRVYLFWKKVGQEDHASINWAAIMGAA